MPTDLLSAPAGSARRKISPRAYAKQLGVDSAKILKWIHSGELRAIDASTTRGGKPRFLIDVADILLFEQRRAVQPAAPTPRRRRRAADGVIEFFK